MHWYGANVDSTRVGRADAFRVFGPGIETRDGGEIGDIDLSRTVHLALDVHSDGAFSYRFGNSGSSLREITGRLPEWHSGGYVGILTWNSAAKFSHIAFEERDEAISFGSVAGEGTFAGNKTQGGSWTATNDTLHSVAKKAENEEAFVYFQDTGNDFVYEADVQFLSENASAALLFRNADKAGHSESYAASFSQENNVCKLMRYEDGRKQQLFGEIKLKAPKEQDWHHLCVVCAGDWISFAVDGELVGSTGDYYASGTADVGQNTCIKSGTFGLMNCGGEMEFRNIRHTPLSKTFTPLLTKIEVSSDKSKTEAVGAFNPREPISIQYVGYEAETVDIAAVAESAETKVSVFGADGKEYSNGKNVPLAVGANYISVVCTAKEANGATAVVAYRVNVHRRRAANEYYTEKYRCQYHYSVKDGWGNDPNGLVYYKGKYHLFYQFYDGIAWGPMHWGHAVSSDLLHWQERPVAFYPDANGAMFSRCIVADEENTSGFFEKNGGGLVALITMNGGGQRIKLAYSRDDGETWTKADGIALDWTVDEIASPDFRDPKVFRYDNKWFMVIAGGQLRIYSSDNLRDWQCESVYRGFHTECPDMYPVRADDGKVKWVLSRGGRLYKIGDFKRVKEKWQFVPDEEYKEESANAVMNFGHDSYAAMTYYVRDFGTEAKPNVQELIELNWLNSWDDYCNKVAEKNGESFNGTYTMFLSLGLKAENGKYVLTQKPIRAYNALRGEKVAGEAAKSYRGDCYEMIAELRKNGEEVSSIDVRSSESEYTRISYDWNKKRLNVDRSKSGIILSDKFACVESVELASVEDSVKLHIFVDRASLEVFSDDYTACGAWQIFPSENSTGVSWSDSVDLTIYPMKSIW